MPQSCFLLSAESSGSVGATKKLFLQIFQNNQEVGCHALRKGIKDVKVNAMANPASVLIVEDDRFLSTLIKTRLAKEGFETRQAFNGDEALAALRSAPADLIILDLIMPKMSGFEFLEAKSLDPQISQIPVIVLSNLAQDSDVEKAKQFGAKEYFVKVRISIDSIADKVKEIIVTK